MAEPSKISDKSVDRIATLFAGYSKASGTHGVPEREPNGLKWSIKKTAKTLTTGPSLEMWEKHLSGTRPLGIVPIMDDSRCLWGSIDIDEYNIDVLEIVARVESMKLPLVPCRSKSGGLHLFLFCSEPVPAATLQLALRNLAAVLGYADSEIFPKQTAMSEGASGNWMVMPYFGGTFGGKLKEQRGLKKTGAEMTIEEFLTLAERAKLTADKIAVLHARVSLRNERPLVIGRAGAVPSLSTDPDAPFGDGPPCLQELAATPQSGLRNETLFSMGVYFKRKHPDPDDWKKELEKANELFCAPPLERGEMHDLIKQISRKDYNYKCASAPICGACRPTLCRTREYGVGGSQLQLPVITSWTMVESDKPFWDMTIAGSDDVMRIDDVRNLADYKRFREACMSQLGRFEFLPRVADITWAKALAEARPQMKVVRASEDTTRRGVLFDHLENFLTNRSVGHWREELLGGKPWFDEENDRFCVLLRAFTKYLDQEKMRNVTEQECADLFKSIGGKRLDDMRLKEGRRIRNVWVLPRERFQAPPEVPAPPPAKEVI